MREQAMVRRSRVLIQAYATSRHEMVHSVMGDTSARRRIEHAHFCEVLDRELVKRHPAALAPRK